MTFSRGLAALILSILFINTTLSAEFLYKDEIINDKSVTKELRTIGTELKEKTGIGLYVAVIKELAEDQSLVDFEKQIASELQEPFVLLTLSIYDKKIDILARPTDLYKSFDKEQVLSPFPNSGTILPFLAWKNKDATIAQKAGAAVQNGYMDMAAQIADYKDVELNSVPQDTNKTIFTILRLFFYGMILYAAYLWIKRKLLTRRKNEDE